MKENINVDLGGLAAISKELNNAGSDIYNTYKSKVSNALQSSDDCFYVSGLNTDAILNNFNDIYTSLNKQITELCDLLDNKIIPQYNELNYIVTRMFNNDFANQLESLLPGIKR